jgi:PAS domain S-box-containing protein
LTVKDKQKLPDVVLRSDIIEKAELGVYIMQDGIVVYLNPSLARMFGYSVEEVAGKLGLVDLVHKDDLAVAMQRTGARQAGEIGREKYSYRGIRKDGTQNYIEVYGQKIDYHGRPAVLGTVIDVTEQKIAEDRLAESEAKFRQITEKTVYGIYVIQNGKMAYVNPSFAKMFGYQPEEITGKLTPRELVHPDDIEMVSRKISERLAGVVENDNTFLRGVRKDGSLFHLETFSQLIEFNDRPAILGTLVDITDKMRIEELTRAKDAADAASRTKSSFLANISHEIRTPMTAILGYTRLFRSETGISPRQLEYLDLIKQSGEHLLSLINDILEMSKIDAGHMTLKIVEFDLATLLSDTIAIYKLQTDQKKIELSLDCASDLPTFIHGDQGKVRQVLINLLENATKFTEQGEIFIRAGTVEDVKGQKVVIEVEDTGCGIEVDEQEKIFEPFEQASDSLEHGGTGLGLSICRQYARMMGGDINLRSRPGQGSTFYFEFLTEISHATGTKESIDPAVVGDLPEKLRNGLLEAVDSGFVDTVYYHIDEVESLNPQLGLYFRKLAEAFEYKELQRLLSMSDYKNQRRLSKDGTP